MGLLKRIGAALQAFDAAKNKPAATMKGAAEAWGALFASGMEHILGATTMTQPFAQHPIVYACASAIATNIAGLELEFFPSSDEKHETPVKDSVVLETIQSPNDELQGQQLIEGTMVHLELSGNAYWYLSGVARSRADRRRFPTQIDLWMPDKVSPIKERGNLKGWEYRTNFESVKAPLDRVVHFKYFNPYDSVLGLAPLKAAMIVAGGDYKSLVWNDSFFENAAVPFGLLTPEPNQIVHEESLIRLRDQLVGEHRGPTKHGKLGATMAAMRFLEIGMSQKDMDFANLMDKATEKILTVFKVPPAFAGVQKDANYSTSVQQAKQFWHNHLPKARYLERVITFRLCKPFGIEEIPFFKTESVKALTEDQLNVSNMARNYFNMGVPFSQINDRLELGFDADEHESMSIPWIPFSLVDANEQMSAGAFDEPLGGPDREPRPDEGQNQPGDEPTQQQTGIRLVKGRKTRELMRLASWKALISRIRAEEIAMERRVRDHLHGLKREVLRKLQAQKSARPITKQDDPAEFDIDVVMFDKEQAAEDLKKRTHPLYKSSLEKGVRTVLEELQLDIDFDLLTPEVENFLMEKRFQIADLVDGPVSDALRSTLQEGLSAGENLETIADRVEEVFSVQRSRARRIARTEMAESFNGGRYESMKAADVEKIEWLTARDSRVRDEHVRMDGEVIRLGDNFSNGLRYPLDPAGPANEIVNCRCVPLPAA